MKKSISTPVIILVIVLILLCCACLVGTGLTVYGLYTIGNNIDPNNIPAIDFPMIETPTPVVELTRPPVEDIPLDTLQVLEQTIVPNNDPRELACRLEGKCDIPLTVESPSISRQAGEKDYFWVTDIGTNESTQVQATLRYVTEHVYFWVQDGVTYKEADLADLAEAFENQIYPTNREFFGSEWSPGIDGDPHIYILYARGLGWSIAGYFSSADEMHPLAHEYSNAHEMFLFNADTVDLNEEFTYGVLAHEFQHMIHWYVDRNEQSWLNEGMSELAALLNGYDAGGFDWLFMMEPDLQLNDWPNDENATTPHYGAGFLFTTYFLDRFGEQATQALVRSPANGLDSVDEVLLDLNEFDNLRNHAVTADDVVLDWMITNYLSDSAVSDGRYYYHNYPDAPQADATEKFTTCSNGPKDRSVSQYGADYIEISCTGDYTLTFEGSTQSRLLPADPYSGKYAFWSNKGDESNMTLTRQFDFSEVSGPIELSFRIWYDIETDYDYVYLEASQNGEVWDIITTPSGTGDDPSGNSYGWAYNGVTNGWIEETVDLSQYAGGKIFLRFEYVTDAAVNGEGLLLDDVSIPAIGYFTDFEIADESWVADGFVRIQNVLPQTFNLALILKGNEVTTVELISLTEDQTAEIPLSIGGDVREAILVITGTTRFTRERAAYRFEIK